MKMKEINSSSPRYSIPQSQQASGHRDEMEVVGGCFFVWEERR
jgi:hypothetical protein